MSEITPITQAEALNDRFQFIWNDYCNDTGCHPEMFRMERRKLYADFHRGPFGAAVVEFYKANPDQLMALIRECEPGRSHMEFVKAEGRR
jgi:hypothetical protein